MAQHRRRAAARGESAAQRPHLRPVAGHTWAPPVPTGHRRKVLLEPPVHTPRHRTGAGPITAQTPRGVIHLGETEKVLCKRSGAVMSPKFKMIGIIKGI